MILAIDPGPTESGYVVYEDGTVRESGTVENHDMLAVINRHQGAILAVEMVESYGMAVGKTVFETCVWIGRYVQAAYSNVHTPGYVLVPRKAVKLNLCGSARAKDANVRQALIDLLGEPGRKKDPGPTYGVTGHQWAALGVAVVAQEAAENAEEVSSGRED